MTWAVVWLIVGVIGVVVGFPPICALFLVGEGLVKGQVKPGALKTAYVGMGLMIISLVGLIYVIVQDVP
jgi:hypothetical protein